MNHDNFFRLGSIAPLSLRDGFRLDTRALELEMMTNNGGVDLSRIDSSGILGDQEYRKYVPHFFTDDDSVTKEKVSSIVNKYPNITAPCSMALESIQELEECLGEGYQVAHFHYILGKKHNLKGKFPQMCCGLSSRNLMLSLIELGYPNATYAYSNCYDHGYTVLPFVLKKESISGTVLIDPTFDQLWKKPSARNAVFIKLGTKWEYITDWANGGNLFPDNVCAIDTLRKSPETIGWFRNYHKSGEKYFQQAFANPIVLH